MQRQHKRFDVHEREVEIPGVYKRVHAVDGRRDLVGARGLEFLCAHTEGKERRMKRRAYPCDEQGGEE